MPEIKPKVETFARIKVVGVGGAGTNAVDRMVEFGLKGIEFVVVNTDAQDLHYSFAGEKIHIGKNLTRGLGAGMNPEIGRQAAEENRDEIQEVLKGADMVFVVYGSGGGTGSGAGPVVAEAAKEAGALTIGVVTKPFLFEGRQRMAIADESIENLRDRVDALIVIQNDKLLQIIDRNTSLLNSFQIVDDVLRQGVQGISDLITKPGIVNVDFADINTIMQDSGTALMGIGVAEGENRALQAAKAAINSPLLDISIDGAKGVLFNITGGEDVTMMEVNEAAGVISDHVDQNARIIFGASIDSGMKRGEIKITVVATGFESSPNREQQRRFEPPKRRLMSDDETASTSANSHGSISSVSGFSGSAFSTAREIPAFESPKPNSFAEKTNRTVFSQSPKKEMPLFEEERKPFSAFSLGGNSNFSTQNKSQTSYISDDDSDDDDRNILNKKDTQSSGKRKSDFSQDVSSSRNAFGSFSSSVDDKINFNRRISASTSANTSGFSSAKNSFKEEEDLEVPAFIRRKLGK